MSFLINIVSSSQFDSTIIQYERIAIYAVAEMNKIYAKENNFYDLCLNCFDIKYMDAQGQNDYLEIDHISAIIEKGWAKCDSLVAWFIAIKELSGFIAEPIIVPHDGRFHVKMKYRPIKGSDKDWKQIDPTQIIKGSCGACEE